MAEKVPGWIEKLLLPQLSELKAEVKIAQDRIDGVEEKLEAKIGGLEGRMDAEFKTVHAEISGLDYKIDALDKRTDMTQRLALVEEQVRELRARPKPA
jgi:hypothetical protein